MVWIITLEKKYCNAIIDGRKKVEVRTRIPKALNAGDAVIVCMKGSDGQVPFYFTVDGIGFDSPQRLWNFKSDLMAIDKKDYDEYTKGRDMVFCLHIRHVYKYDIDVTINDFGVRKAPQWFTAVPCPKTALIVGSGVKNY